jgi:hypothetical protein
VVAVVPTVVVVEVGLDEPSDEFVVVVVVEVTPLLPGAEVVVAEDPDAGGNAYALPLEGLDDPTV